MKKFEAGKGDERRPSQVSEEEYGLRHDYAFRKDLLDSTYEEWLKIKKDVSS